MTSLIDFSAQFGGSDAHAAVRPHFRLLKSIAREHRLTKFPYKEMSFIFRVDGEVNSYGLSGPGNLDFYRTDYVSVDIGIRAEDYAGGSERLAGTIADAIRGSVGFMRQSSDARLREIDFEALEATLSRLCEAYEEAVRSGTQSEDRGQ